jgi:hypothetical protein
MLTITTASELIDPLTRMRPSLAQYSAPVSSVQAPSWADFITTIVGFRVFGTHSRATRPDPRALTARRAVLTLSFRLCGRRIDIGYSAKAVGFGVVRSGDKRAAHFRAVPARYDTKPERLLCFDVARREILHGSAFMCALDPASNAGLISDEQIISSILVGEPDEVRQDGVDQIAVMRICRSQCRGI